MKKLISLFLALTMLLGVAYAFAEEEVDEEYEEGYEEYEVDPSWTYKDVTGDDENYYGSDSFYNGKLASSYGSESDDESWSSATAYYYEFDDEEIVPSETPVWYNVWGSDEDGYYDISFNADGSVYEASPWGNSTNSEYYDSETGKWYDKETGEETDTPNLSGLLNSAKKISSRVAIYNNNTATLAGISLRDAYPGLTSKFYNVVPVDLSKDGTQSFPLVASDMFIVGKVNVTVAGDEVTAELEYATSSEDSLKPLGECVAWFTSVDQITGEFLDNPTSDMAFGKAISKSKDLDGKDIALLFVCNKISFRVPFIDGNGPARFVRSAAGMREYLKGLNDLMAKIK